MGVDLRDKGGKGVAFIGTAAPRTHGISCLKSPPPLAGCGIDEERDCSLSQLVWPRHGCAVLYKSVLGHHSSGSWANQPRLKPLKQLLVEEAQALLACGRMWTPQNTHNWRNQSISMPDFHFRTSNESSTCMLHRTVEVPCIPSKAGKCATRALIFRQWPLYWALPPVSCRGQSLLF